MYKNTKPLTVNIISDIHCFAKENGITGEAFNKANSKTPTDMKHSSEIIAGCFNQLAKDNDTDIILLSGDVTNKGEPDGHKEVIRLLRQLKAKGKRVYVITATHDYTDDGMTTKYEGDTSVTVKGTAREDIFEMYREFGPDEAISVHKKSMSYVVQLCDGYRLFALNDDKDENGHSGFSDECFLWIRSQIEQAKKDGQFIIAMTHHPMISPSPFYSIIGKNDMMANAQKRCGQLADLGVPFIFTGHTHMEDISFTYSKKGNIFYDITSASIVGYPATYRKVVFTPAERKISITSQDITEKMDFLDDETSLKTSLENKFFGMIKDVIVSAANDTPKLAKLVTSFSIKESLIYKIGWLIKPFAKILNKLTIGNVAKLCKKESGLKKSDYEEIKDQKVVDFIMSLVTNLYGGDSPYTPDTAQYKITVGFLSVVDSVLKALHIKIGKLIKGTDSVISLVEPLLFNAGIPDKNAVIELFPLHNENNPKTQDEVKKIESPEFPKSRKGVPVIIITVLLVLIFLPIILLWLICSFIINRIRFSKEMRKLKDDEKKRN